MNSNRRNFLKSSIVGAGLLSSGIIVPACVSGDENNKSKKVGEDRAQLFNMCGYAAPKLDVVRVGFIGLGNRGPVHLNSMMHQISLSCVNIDYSY